MARTACRAGRQDGVLGAALAAMALLVIPSGCTVGPDYRTPSATALALPSRFSIETPPGSAPPGTAELASWWTALEDPVLDGLVKDALAASPDIVAAGGRLRAARGATRGARAGLLPTLDASASAGRSALIGKGSDALIATPGLGAGTSTLLATNDGGTTLDAGLDASYEADIFGGVKRSVQAARADESSAAENLHDTQRSVVAEVAIDYITARSAQERLAIARSNLHSQDETVQIVGWRVRAGLTSSLDLAQARAQREQTAASIPSFETSFVQSSNALAILIGQAPGSIAGRLQPPQPVPIADRVLGADVPAAVLSRRPDVRAAERTLAAATARIGVAKAQLYPALRLTGSLGGSGGSVGDITRFTTGSLIAAISAPIFDGGAIRGQIEQARGNADVALATYRTTVLTALGDVENAMTALANTRVREVALALAVDDSRNALLLAQSQYRAGLVDFQVLLDSERTLLSSEDGLASARADRASALVQLYKALGGGWQAAPIPDSALPGTLSAIERPDIHADPAPTTERP
jgi:NodT family efflux transporter outer membrane factor (OMF) lipoprotein